MHVNCWEFKKCGKEKDESCPAVTKKLGKSCWMVAGTMCGGKPQGIFAEKVKTCSECDFFQYKRKVHGRA